MLFIFKLESLRKEEDNRVNFAAKIFCKQNFSLQYEGTFLFWTFQFYITVINRCLLPFIVVLKNEKYVNMPCCYLDYITQVVI